MGRVRQRKSLFYLLGTGAVRQSCSFWGEDAHHEQIKEQNLWPDGGTNPSDFNSGWQALARELGKMLHSSSPQSSCSLDLWQALGYSSDSTDDDHCAVLFQMHWTHSKAIPPQQYAIPSFRFVNICVFIYRPGYTFFSPSLILPSSI